ncbi:DUF485 domain-containing protein [Streptomyces sp. 7R007]
MTVARRQKYELTQVTPELTPQVSPVSAYRPASLPKSPHTPEPASNVRASAHPPDPSRARSTGMSYEHHHALGHHSDLRILRSAYRWQRRTATLTALGYFTLFLLLSAFAPSFMTSTVTDGLPTGLLLALAQIPVTWLAIVLYERTARRYVDPIADRIRRESELDARRRAAR